MGGAEGTNLECVCVCGVRTLSGGTGSGRQVENSPAPAHLGAEMGRC